MELFHGIASVRDVLQEQDSAWDPMGLIKRIC
jgi:hypothetical protein